MNRDRVVKTGGDAGLFELCPQDGAALIDRDARAGRRLHVDVEVGVQACVQPTQSVDRDDFGDQLTLLVFGPRRFELERKQSADGAHHEILDGRRRTGRDVDGAGRTLHLLGRVDQVQCQPQRRL